MKGKGSISVRPNRRVQIVVVAQILWLALICALGGWWGHLVLKQGARISELEAKLGLSAADAATQLARTHRMVLWESSVFFAVLLAITFFVFWLSWSEHRRSRGVQAFFASLIPHELRTPLTSIRLQAEALARRLRGSGQDNLLNRLLEDASRLESQVERTLELARVEGGGPVTNRAVPVKPWLEYQVRTWSEGRGGGVPVKLEIQGCADAQIQADPHALQIILVNLLENSVRHAGSGGPRDLRVTAAISGGRVLVTCSDAGSGFEGDLSKLGQLFQKGPHSRGAGVGLYLVSTLMERMGGKAEFLANPGFTTKLHFRPAREGVAESPNG